MYINPINSNWAMFEDDNKKRRYFNRLTLHGFKEETETTVILYYPNGQHVVVATEEDMLNWVAPK